MATTMDIPRSQWPAFFNAFSEQHQGWQARVELLDPDEGPQELAHDVRFLGVSMDESGSEPGAVMVSAGDQPGNRLGHLVERPRRIEVREEAPGTDLKIEPEEGPSMLIHLTPSTAIEA